MTPIRKAFSLIELSIVILIVGIIVAGVTQSSRLVTKFKTSSANSLTESSPVSSIYGLVLWLETTKKESFDSNIDPSSDTLNAVSNWYDINTQSTKVNATQSNSANQAQLVENSPINSLPALRFNGTTDFYTGSPILSHTSPAFTIYVVGMTFDASVRNTIFGQYHPTTSDTNHFLRTGTNGIIECDEFNPTGNSATSATGSIVGNVPFIVSMVRANNIPKIYKNGSLLVTGNAEIYSGATPVSFEIGRRGGTILDNYFNGFIGELIVFNKALTSEERSAVDNYLSRKWAIKLN